MEQVMQIINNMAATLKEYLLVPLIFILIALAGTLIFGEHNEKIQKAKKIIGGGILGVGIIALLIPLAETISGWFIF
ncbi:MAG: hypothetical protein K2H01_01125 [Ruminococcus sp.]|nr:hypothetical protein [Ruminococcus sp.]